jgi:hypothetical protein
MEYISSQSKKEKGLSLKETLKYIKETQLYIQRKAKLEEAARLPLTDESVAANLRDMMPALCKQ